jgi:uncharacterized SAM-binding protein YcdF (DUF218 family)
VRRIVAVAVVGALLWGEYENWRASREFVREVPAEREVVVVLGSRNRARRANALNRWRVRAGLRSRDPRATRSCLVLSGGAVSGAVSEAALMADYAAARGRTDDVVLEAASRTTWENIEQIVPLVEQFDRIKIVSNPLHARKARMYLARQRPDLAERLARGSDYRFGEWMPAKVVFAVYGRVTGVAGKPLSRHRLA